jgi:hypothetical protein
MMAEGTALRTYSQPIKEKGCTAEWKYNEQLPYNQQVIGGRWVIGLWPTSNKRQGSLFMIQY